MSTPSGQRTRCPVGERITHALFYADICHTTGENPADEDVFWHFESSNAVAAPRRRRDFGEFLRRHGTTDSDYDAAETIFGELVANVVRHAPGTIRILVEWSASAPILHVQDRGHGFTWKPTLPADPLGESARGLYIVQRLSSDVRVARCEVNGTRVSALLPVKRRIGVVAKP